MKRSFIFLIATLLLLAGCSSGENKEVSSKKVEKETTNSGDFKSYTSEQKKEETANSGKYTTITSDKAKDLLTKGNITIIDVRKQESFSESHIPNAQNIPLNELGAKQAEMDKNVTYLIVCKSGKTSETACKLLAENGFSYLYNLSGGMDGWTGDVVN